MAEFWAGLSEPSRLAAVMLAIGIAISLSFLLWLFNPTTLCGPLGAYLPQNRIDSHAFVTVDTLRLARSKQTRPRILMLGASTIEQPFGDGQSLHRAIEGQSGQDWEVHVLAAASQSPLEQMSILETALAGRGPEDPSVVVTMTAGLWRATWTRERMLGPEPLGRLGLRSKWADEEMQHLGGTPGLRTGFYVADNFRFLATNSIMTLRQLALNSPSERLFSPHARTPPRTGQARFRRGTPEAIEGALTEFDAYIAQLERMILRLQDVPGVQLVLFEDLMSPDVPDLLGIEDHVHELDRRILEVSSRHNVPFWRIGSDAELGPNDYNDAVHTKTGEPQGKVVAVTAERFAEFFKSQETL